MRRNVALFIIIIFTIMVYSADFEVSTREVAFGDVVELSFPGSGTAEVSIPDFSVTGSGSDNGKIVIRGIPLTTGSFSIPPHSVSVIGEEEISVPETTVEIRVLSRLQGTNETELDPDAGPRDISPVYNYRNIILLIVFVLTVLFLIYYFLLRKKIENVVFGSRREAEHVEAARRIKELRVKNYLATGNQKAFCVELSSIIRTYLGRRYKFAAHEMTTEELDKYFLSEDPDIPERDTFMKYFRQMDLVKFAKYTLDEKTLEHMLDHTEKYVEKTRRVDDETGE